MIIKLVYIVPLGASVLVGFCANTEPLNEPIYLALITVYLHDDTS